MDRHAVVRDSEAIRMEMRVAVDRVHAKERTPIEVEP